MKTVGFIGFGRVVEWHMACLRPEKSIQVSFVCDISLERRKVAKSMLPNTEVFESIRQLCLSSIYQSTDYIVIATPTGSHFEIAKEILGKSNATVLIEKPTFLRIDDYEQLKSYTSRIVPIFQNRYNPAVLKAVQTLNSLDCKISHASLAVDWSRPQRYYDLADWRGTWHSDGGVSTNQGIHYFDIARCLLGDFGKVQCHMKRRLVKIDCEDYLSAFIELTSGVPLDVRMTTSLRHTEERASLSIHTEKGSIYIGGVCCNEIRFLSGDEEAQSSFSYAEDVVTPYGNGQREIYRQLAAGNLGKLSTLADSKSTMRFIHACYESALTGKAVNAVSSFKNSPLGQSIDDIVKFS